MKINQDIKYQDTTIDDKSSKDAPLVDLKEVTLIYSGREKPALTNINLSIKRGERICLLGANGSGKSTLSKVIAGIMAPDYGSVSYRGKIAFCDSQGVNSDIYMHARKNTAYVFQDPEDQIVARIVEEDVAFGPENKGLSTKRIRQLVDTCLKTVAMDEYALSDISTLSGGQQQRVAIASALAMEPKLFIADEPASMLDIRGRKETLRLLRRLQDTGCTIVHVTHFVEEAKHADRIILMEQGSAVFDGSYSQLLEHPHLLLRQNLELPFDLRVKKAMEKDSCLDEYTHKSSGCRLSKEVQIKAENLSFTYDASNHGLTNLTFDIHKAEFVCLIGQTGSGKTTLAKTLAGLNPDFSGSLDVLGQSLKSRKMRNILQGKIGYIMQKPERQLFAETVGEDVAYGPRCQGLDEDEVQRRVKDTLDELKISDLIDKSPFELSGGQQRLVAIAGVLSMRPEILILDEPCASLDSAASSLLLDILRELNCHGLTCIMVTHSMEDAASMADTIYVLSKGKIVTSGTARHVFENEELLNHIGLGLPAAALFVQDFNRKHDCSLKTVLTFDELICELQHAGVSYELV